MKRFLYPLLFLLAVSGLNRLQAQDEAIFSHYIINPILINPAVAGFQEEFQLFGHLRAHQTGFTEFPKTYALSYNGPIGNTFGLGALVMSDNAAQLNRFRVQLQYAFRFQLGDNVKLGVGFSTDIQQWRLDNSIMDDSNFQPGDDILDDYLNGRWFFDASVGAYSTFGENGFAGISVINLVQNRLDNIAIEGGSGGPLQYFTLYGGYRFVLENEGIEITPSAMVHQVRNSPFEVDFNVLAGFFDRQFQAGLSYRTTGTMSMLVGTSISFFEFYYSYDFLFDQFSDYNAGSHELTLAFRFKPRPKGPKPPKR